MEIFDLKALFPILSSGGLALLSVAAAEDGLSLDGSDYPDVSMPPTAAPPSEGPGSSDNYAALYKCIEKISPVCGKDVFQCVFMGRDYPAADCCRELVAIGKPCHDMMVEGMASKAPEYGRELDVKGRSELVWKHCLLIGGGMSPSRSSKGSGNQSPRSRTGRLSPHKEGLYRCNDPTPCPPFIPPAPVV